MTELKIEDLLSKEDYEKERDFLLSESITKKELRTITIGRNVNLFFENKETVLNKTQEFLRDGDITSEGEIKENLSIYQSLLADTQSLKATMVIDCSMEKDSNSAIKDKKGVEDRVWIQIGENDRVFSNSTPTVEGSLMNQHQIVFILEFNLSNLMIKDFHADMTLYAGVDHPKYNVRTKEILKITTASLAKELT